MGEKPKKDKDRLKRQKNLRSSKDKAVEKEHLENVSGGHEIHSRIASGYHAAYSEIDRKTR